MYAHSTQAGVLAALRTYGLSKHANVFSPAFWKEVATTTRNQAVGHPVEALKQIRAGTLFKPGTGLYHQGLPRTVGSVAGSLAVPLALTALFAKMSPESSRGEVVGDMLGRTAGSMLGGPLAGTVGTVGGGMLLANAGRAIGSHFDPKHPVENSEVAAGE